VNQFTYAARFWCEPARGRATGGKTIADITKAARHRRGAG